MKLGTTYKIKEHDIDCLLHDEHGQPTGEKENIPGVIRRVRVLSQINPDNGYVKVFDLDQETTYPLCIGVIEQITPLLESELREV